MESKWIKAALEVNRTTQLTTLNVTMALEEIIREICEDNDVRYLPGAYALKVQGFRKLVGTEYATEENKKELKHGCQLKLSRSPSEKVASLIDQLHKAKDADSSLKSLREMAAASKDSVLLQEMHKQKALQHLRVSVSVRELSDDEYYCFYKVLGHFLAKDYIQQPCEDEVTHLMDAVICDTKTTREMLLLSFELLILLRKNGKLDWPVTNLRNLARYVRMYGEMKVQERAIQLINYLYLYAIDRNERNTVQEFMRSSLMITYINKYVIRECLSDSMKQQLYIYQKIILRKYNQQLFPSDLKEDEMLELLEYIVANIILENQVKNIQIPFEVHRMSEQSQDSDRTSQMLRYLKGLLSPGGRQKTFSVSNSPALEARKSTESFLFEDDNSENLFLSEKIEEALELDRQASVESASEYTEDDPLRASESMPEPAEPEVTSALARDNLYYFIMTDLKGFEEFLLFHKTHLRSVLCVSVKVTNLLCRIFEIHHGEPELKKGRFVPLCFLYFDHIFEKMFCTAIKLFHRTRQEMNIALDSSEYSVVLSTVGDQLRLALEAEPVDFIELEKRLEELNVEVVQRKWTESIKKEVERQLTQEPAFVELKEMISPQIMSRIEKKRLIFMEDGEHVPQFDYKGQKVVGKRWFLYISKRHDMMVIEECPDDPCKSQHKPLESVQVSDIVEVECGTKSNFHKEVYYNLCSERDMFFRPGVKQQESELRYPISLRIQNHYYVDFCAGSALTMDYWVDGLNFLTGAKMTSKTVTEEYNYLTDIELMMHLAGLEGTQFPEKAPPVPPPPTDYNFCTL